MLVAALGLVPVASADTGTDLTVQACDGDARTIDGLVVLGVRAGEYLVEHRYSPACQGSWTRITTLNQPDCLTGEYAWHESISGVGGAPQIAKTENVSTGPECSKNSAVMSREPGKAYRACGHSSWEGVDHCTEWTSRIGPKDRVSDFSGDGHADLLAVDGAFNVRYYPNNNNSLSGYTTIGSGWGNFTNVFAADFSGDGHADVLGVDVAGNLRYYPNNNNSLGGNTIIGAGWDTFRQVFAADFSGDGAADIFGVNWAGELWYYPNNNYAISSATKRKLGDGWDRYQWVFAADFSGDGAADVLAVTFEGDLYYYPNNNYSLAGAYKIGAGWLNLRNVFAADFNGDGYADVLAVDSAGKLRYYPNNKDNSLGNYITLGTGWNSLAWVF
jgi:hypothetical protein